MQRSKQKIEDLETAIAERERRLGRVGSSVAQVQMLACLGVFLLTILSYFPTLGSPGRVLAQMEADKVKCCEVLTLLLTMMANSEGDSTL